MAVRQFNTQLSGTPTLTATTETVIMTLPGVSTNGAQDQVFVSGSMAVTAGTAATGVTVRVRRGTGITGTVIGTAEVDSVTAATTEPFPFDAFDTPGEVAGQQYVVTAQQVAATGNGTAIYGAAQISLGP